MRRVYASTSAGVATCWISVWIGSYAAFIRATLASVALPWLSAKVFPKSANFLASSTYPAAINLPAVPSQSIAPADGPRAAAAGAAGATKLLAEAAGAGGARLLTLPPNIRASSASFDSEVGPGLLHP